MNKAAFKLMPLLLTLAIAVTGCSKSGDPCSGYDVYLNDTEDVSKPSAFFKDNVICNTENEVELRQLFLSSLYIADSKPENRIKAKKWIDLALSGDAKYNQLSYRFLLFYYYFVKVEGNSSEKFLSDPANVEIMKKMLRNSISHGNYDHLPMLLAILKTENNSSEEQLKWIMVGMMTPKQLPDFKDSVFYEDLKSTLEAGGYGSLFFDDLPAQRQMVVNAWNQHKRQAETINKLNTIFNDAVNASKFVPDQAELRKQVDAITFEQKKRIEKAQKQAERRKNWPSGAIAEIQANSIVCDSYKNAMKADIISRANNPYASLPYDCTQKAQTDYAASVQHINGGIAKINRVNGYRPEYTASRNIKE